MKTISIFSWALVLTLPFASYAQDEMSTKKQVSIVATSSLSITSGALAYRELVKDKKIYTSKFGKAMAPADLQIIQKELVHNSDVLLTIRDRAKTIRREALEKQIEDLDTWLGKISVAKKNLQREANEYAITGLGILRPKRITQEWNVLVKQQGDLVVQRASLVADYKAANDIKKVLLKGISYKKLFEIVPYHQMDKNVIESMTKVNSKVTKSLLKEASPVAGLLAVLSVSSGVYSIYNYNSGNNDKAAGRFESGRSVVEKSSKRVVASEVRVSSSSQK